MCKWYRKYYKAKSVTCVVQRVLVIYRKYYKAKSVTCVSDIRKYYKAKSVICVSDIENIIRQRVLLV